MTTITDKYARNINKDEKGLDTATAATGNMLKKRTWRNVTVGHG